MKDLKIRYNNENEEIKKCEYDTIMDFIDEMESDSIDIPMRDYNVVEATFFEEKRILCNHGRTFRAMQTDSKIMR